MIGNKSALPLALLGQMRAGDMNQSFVQQIKGLRTVFIGDDKFKTLPFKRVREQRCTGITTSEEDASGILPAIADEPNLRIDAARLRYGWAPEERHQLAAGPNSPDRAARQPNGR